MFVAPAAFAVLTASVTMLPAPRPEPARPALSRIPEITGAAVGVLIVVTNGDKPFRRTCLPAILVCPNEAPCFACPYTGRSSESMSTNARSPMPASMQTAVRVEQTLLLHPLLLEFATGRLLAAQGAAAKVAGNVATVGDAVGDSTRG